ncbi:amidohydrolase family protein [Blastopirellula marina]|nr:amidohydrolase family protein [Blastopirellula marina]
MIFRYSLLSCIVLFSATVVASASDQVPGKMPEGPVAIVGATIHPVSGDVIEKGTVLFDQGKITAVGKDVEVPEGAEVVKAEGKHVYPGLFEPYSMIGLVEFSSIRATKDYNETGTNNPNVKAHVAINPDSEVIPVTRSNGVLLAVTAPTGGLIPGQAAVIQLDGWTYEDMTVQPEVAMAVGIRSERDTEQLEEILQQAKQYAAAKENDVEIQHDMRLEAMGRVITGEQPIIVEADRWEAIVRAVNFAEKQDLKLIILGGYEAPKCAELLKRADVPVIISAVHRTPMSIDEPYDGAYTLAKRLQDKGIRFCISGYDRSNYWNTRNLPYHAGTAAAFGLSKEDAIRAITLSPAEILGVADRVGSIEEGKDATLILCDGDPLETFTHTESAWIAGKPVDLSNKQKMLYEKYQKKYE